MYIDLTIGDGQGSREIQSQRSCLFRSKSEVRVSNVLSRSGTLNWTGGFISFTKGKEDDQKPQPLRPYPDEKYGDLTRRGNGETRVRLSPSSRALPIDPSKTLRNLF